MRVPRRHEARAFFHVTSHGIDDRAVFADDVDRQTFVNRLGHLVTRFSWRVYAVCLMTTHYHVLLQLDDANLSAGMTILNGAHARLFNRRRGRRGPVFDARFHDQAVEDDAHLLSTIRYIALNPVAAAVVDRPQDYEWSTYGQLIGVRASWPCFAKTEALQLFGSIQAARRFVEVPGTEVPGTS